MASRSPVPSTAPPRRGEWGLDILHALPYAYVAIGARHSDGEVGSGRGHPAPASSPLVRGGGGGSRAPLRRVPPVPGLDAEQRVQADVRDPRFVQMRAMDEDLLRAKALHPLKPDHSSGSPLPLLAPSSRSSIEPVSNKKNADKDLPILSLIIQKNDHHLTDAVLTYMKTLLCGILDCTTFSEKLQAGTNFASEIVATILIGLHMSETRSQTGFFCKSADSSTMYEVTSMMTASDEDLLRAKALHPLKPDHSSGSPLPLLAPSSRSSIEPVSNKKNADKECCADESYVCFARDDEDKWLIYGFETVETEDTWEHLLARFKDCSSGDTGSTPTTKIKSFAEPPVQLDEEFFLNWLGSSESQDTLSEVLAGITSPVGTGFFCKSADSSTMYATTPMACRFAVLMRVTNDKDKWLIHGFETVETEDSWEHLLERFKDCKLQPEVVFFEVIK